MRRSRSDESDAVLIQAVAEGDRGALAQLYHRYGPVLLALAQRIVGERRAAEDLLHDVFLEVWRCAAAYNPARGSVRAWLSIRMRSRAIDSYRSARHGQRCQERGASQEVAAEVDTKPGDDGEQALLADQAVVRSAVAGLPAEQRQVLELTYFEGLSSSEIAARLATPVGTVKSRVAAAMARLRGLLCEEAPRKAPPGQPGARR